MIKPIGITLTASYVVLFRSCISYKISELNIYLSMILLFVFFLTALLVKLLLQQAGKLTLKTRDVTKFEFDNVQTSTIFSRFEILLMF